MSSLVIVIVGMAAVTYLPRTAAVAAASRISSLPPWSRKWLRGIPFATFGALIVPGIWTSVPSSPSASLLGAGVGAALAFFRTPSIICVLAALGVAASVQFMVGV